MGSGLKSAGLAALRSPPEQRAWGATHAQARLYMSQPNVSPISRQEKSCANVSMLPLLPNKSSGRQTNRRLPTRICCVSINRPRVGLLLFYDGGTFSIYIYNVR